jgi:copper transport protein
VRALRQFSRRALVAVWILIAAAIMLVAFRLPNPEAVFLSRYGNLVLAKAALLGVLLALAALNRFRFVPARALPALRRSIGGEIAAMLGVLAVTAVLAQTPPPRAAAIEHAWRATLGTGDRLVELTLSPHHPGANTVLLRFRDRHDAPFDPHEVVIEIANSAAGVEPYVRQARRTAAGEYRLDGAPFAVAGNWSLRVDARVGDFDKLVFRTEVPIH